MYVLNTSGWQTLKKYIFICLKKIGGPGSLSFRGPSQPRSQRECKSASGENVCQIGNFRHNVQQKPFHNQKQTTFCHSTLSLLHFRP